MELGSLKSRVHTPSGIIPTQIAQTPQEKIRSQLDLMLNRWNYSSQELEALKQCFLKMWSTEAAQNNPDAFAQKQLSLLEDMDKYSDLCVACFDLTIINSSGSDENVFPLFLELQEKLIAIIGNNPKVRTLFEQSKEQPINRNSLTVLDSYPVLQDRLRTEFGWQGRIYNKNSPLPKELACQYKNQPYISITGVPFINLNDEVCFLPQKSGDPTKQKIVCRHYAAQYIKETLEDKTGKGKVNLAPYSTEQSIAQHIPLEIESTFNTLKKNAKRFELINNDKLGQYLCSSFLDMQRPEKQETIKALLIGCPTHAMVVRLRIKGTNGKLIYVLTFYDSTKTNMVVRSETKELSTLKNYSLKQLVNGSNSKEPGWYEDYYDGIEPVSLVMECNLASLTGNVTKKTKVLENFPQDILTSTHLFYLLSENFALNLAGLQKQLQAIGKNSPEKLFHLLAAKSPDGTSGLYMALQDGHEDAIKEYGKLLQLLHKPELSRLVDLLAAKTADGTPGLHMALQQGHADTVRAYASLLQGPVVAQIGPSKLTDLLFAKNSLGTPGLYMALQKGHTDTVNAYGELLQLFPQIALNKLTDLLFAKMADGTPGLYVAMQNGHVEAIRAYRNPLQLLHKRKSVSLVHLLAAKTAEGTSGLFIALQQGHADIIDAYRELLELLHEKEFRQLLDVLDATNEDGKQWGELNSRNSEIIEVHKKLRQLISMWRAKFATIK
ncbi:MAG: ShET2/EspL2 family type secretion system effector toxin [Solimicrobium sp.]|jgi:ankyrin repeat protein|nr:ShET2/EspL2 family type secretion system effector toxin [Solimicrobium sp.]